MEHEAEARPERRRPRIEELKLAAPLSYWPDAALERLAAASSVKWHEPGEVLTRAFELPKAMWIVLDGCLELTRTAASGRRYLSDLLAPPQPAGLIPLLDGRGTLFEAVVRVRSRLITCPSQPVLDELAADAALGLGMLRMLCLRERMEHDRAVANALDPMLVRVCKFVLYLGRRPGMLDGGGNPLPVPVTYEDLADFMGQSQSSVVRVVKTLIAAGAVSKHYRGVVIADMTRLIAIAQAPQPFNPVAKDYMQGGARL